MQPFSRHVLAGSIAAGMLFGIAPSASAQGAYGNVQSQPGAQSQTEIYRTQPGQYQSQPRASTGSLSPDDLLFVNQLGYLSLSQINLADLAQRKSNVPVVNRYADTMRSQYTAFLQRLHELGRAYNVEVATSVNTLPSDTASLLEAKLDNMQAVRDNLFEGIYVDESNFAQKEALNMINFAIANADTPAVRQLAMELRPIVMRQYRVSDALLTAVTTLPQGVAQAGPNSEQPQAVTPQP